MLGQDNYDPTGPGAGTPTPDGIHDLHVVVTGLTPGSTISSVEVVGTGRVGASRCQTL